MGLQVTLCDKPFAASGHIAGKRSFAGLKHKLRYGFETYMDTEMGFQIPSFLEGPLAGKEGTDEGLVLEKS